MNKSSKQICTNGKNCFYNKNGRCRYYHPSEELTMCKNGDSCPFYLENKCKFYHQPKINPNYEIFEQISRLGPIFNQQEYSEIMMKVYKYFGFNYSLSQINRKIYDILKENRFSKKLLERYTTTSIEKSYSEYERRK